MEFWWLIVIIAIVICYIYISKRSRKTHIARQESAFSEPPQTHISTSTQKRESQRRNVMSYITGIPKDFQLTPELSQAFDLMENSKKHLFVTGKAGTGKSTLLQYFKEKTKKNIVVVAPTGIAAINVGGSTIHSFFHFPPRLVTKDHIKVIHSKREIFTSLDALVIDEVSMVRADIIDAIDYSLRINRDRYNEPFGGVQMILIGDLYQLPPIVESELQSYFEDNFQSPFFFSAKIIDHVEIAKIELQKVFRQNDPEFIGLLNKIRNNQVAQEDLRYLNQNHRTVSPTTNELAITLTSTNAIASKINLSRLNSLSTIDFYYDACIAGDFDEKYFPTDKRLRLREGAQIMMVKNDPDKKWVNGTIGVIQKLSKDSIHVSFGNYSCQVEPSFWEKIDYEYDQDTKKIVPIVIGDFRQYPIKLAWAITVHKSQGKTFDKVIIDLGNGAFAHGQAYVALSRCRTLQGISLRTPIKLSDIILDNRVVSFLSQRA